MTKNAYPIVVCKLSTEDGGGFVAYAPDLAGCMGDGETEELAIDDLRGAIKEWIDLAENKDIPIPKPYSASDQVSQERNELRATLIELRDQYERLLDEVERIVEANDSRSDDNLRWKAAEIVKSGCISIDESDRVH